MQQKRTRLLSLIFALAAALWLIVLFVLAHQSAAESGALSGGLTEFILKICPWMDMDAAQLEPILRKLAHGLGFALEGFLLCMALALRLWITVGALLSGGVCALMAVLTELVQTLADGRSCELRDMAIDFGGAVGGILLVMPVLLLLRRRADRNC